MNRKLSLSANDLMDGLTLRVRIARSFTIRTRLACWLIGLAGRVINVPCEIDVRTDVDVKAGDVVSDLWDARSKSKAARVMTVHSVDESGIAVCVWFEGNDLHHARFRVGSLIKIEE